MSWLTPLGFLGLISIIALIIIYIIKPNYQNKQISSTFIWKLSLKYRKNKLPINKLRNIIIFLCQVLILTSASSILAQPFFKDEAPKAQEKVLIIDASASMMAKTGSTTRFEKAVLEAKDAVRTQLELEDGKVSVILATEKAYFLAQNESPEGRDRVLAALDQLITSKNVSEVCTWGDSDVKGAIKLAEEITSVSESVEVVLFTDVKYIDAGRVTVVPVNDVNDLNVAILDVRAINDENYYRFEIDIASYGANDTVRVICEIAGINETTEKLELVADVRCDYDQVTTVAFGKIPEVEEELFVEILEDIEVTSYENVYVHVNEKDALDTDNSFYLYGGTKPTLRVQYYSETPNNYFGSALMVLRNQLKYRWNLEIVEVQGEDTPASSGFDFYIYEHKMPSSLPTDGFVLLVNPDTVPTGAGFRLGGVKGFYEETPLSAAEEAHPVMNMITGAAITVTRYLPITSADGFTPLLYCDNDPVFIVKNDPNEKVAVLSFSLNFSNLPVMLEFPLMMYNLVEYFMPSTVTEFVFDVNETISLGARGEELHLSAPGKDEQVFTEFPITVTLTTPGVYTTSQTPISGVEATDYFYVKLPASESNINRSEDALAKPFFYEKTEDGGVDLLIFFAAALVLLLFMEWWLNTREQYQIGKQK